MNGGTGWEGERETKKEEKKDRKKEEREVLKVEKQGAGSKRNICS